MSFKARFRFTGLRSGRDGKEGDIIYCYTMCMAICLSDNICLEDKVMINLLWITYMLDS